MTHTQELSHEPGEAENSKGRKVRFCRKNLCGSRATSLGCGEFLPTPPHPLTACQGQKVLQLSAAGHVSRGNGGLWLGILHSPECLGRHRGCVFCTGHHRGWGLCGSHSRTLHRGCKQRVKVGSRPPFGNTESYRTHAMGSLWNRAL